MNNIKELEAKYIALWEEIEKLKEEVILVPDNIKIIKNWSNYSMWILNNEWQELYYIYSPQTWGVNKTKVDFIKCKLVKTTYEELKAGDVFYRGNFWINNINILWCYAVKLEDDSYQYWNWKDCNNGNIIWKDYYKVVEFNK